MAIVTDNYYLSLTQDNRVLRVRCSQGDSSRNINLILYNNGSVFTIPSGVSASVRGVRQDGSVFSKSCSIMSNRTGVVLALNSAINGVEGVAIAEIVLTDGSGNKVGTSNFIIQVESNILLRGTVEVGEESPVEYISDLIDVVDALNARVNNIIAPSGEASLSEVVDARLSGYSGTTYQNLKARIDADFAALNNAKADKSNTYTKEEVDEAIAGAEIMTDETLSVSGAAADAKATGDAISALNESLEEIHDVEYHYYTSWVTGSYINTSGATVNIAQKVTNANLMHIVLDVAAGDIYGIKVGDGGAARGYCFIDSQSNVLEVSPGTGAVLETEIQAPTNAAKLVLNSGISNNPYVYKKDNLVTVFREQASSIALLKQNPVFRPINTYNLIDYHTDIAWETRIDPYNGKSINNNVSLHSVLGYIPVSNGDAFTSDKGLTIAFLYDENYTFIRNITNAGGGNNGWWVIKVQEADAAYMRVSFKADNGANNPQLLKIDEPVALYKITTDTFRSDHKLAVPKKQIDGRYVSKDIYDVSVPDVGSETDRRLNMRAIKRELASKGALRIGNFNIYGAMIKFVNWWVVQRELMDYGLNICGFEEVCVPTVDSDGDTLYDWSEVMVNEQFPYDDLIENQTGAARILSDCEVVSGGEYTHTVTVQGYGDVNIGYTKAVVKLPNYHHHRNWTKTMSIYVIHLSTTRVVAEAQIDYLVDVMNADTTEYKVLCSDTNCFRLDDNDKPWCWAYLAEAGLRPCLTDFNVSSYCYPISQEERDSGVLDMIDNVFITSNMKCIGWNIVDSQNYPIAGVSGGYVSDHAMVYADVIFDYVDGFNDV